MISERSEPFGDIELLRNGAVVITALGIIWYAANWVAYNSFYSPLGVSPGDVGFSYSTILANSVDTLLSISIGGTILFLTNWKLVLLTGATALIAGIIGRKDEGITFALLLAATLIVAAVILANVAGDRADDVKRGIPVVQPRYPTAEQKLPMLPIRFRKGLVKLLPIHADPVRITPLSTGSVGKEIAGLRKKRLLYLGQANDTVVLYDSQSQEAVQLPKSSVALQLSNCSTQRSADPLCKQAR